MSYKSEDELKGVLDAYALVNGFRWSIGRSKAASKTLPSTATGFGTTVTLKCHKFGPPAVTAPGKTPRNRRVIKCNCPCRVNYSYRLKTNMWFINLCRLEHNHPLTNGSVYEVNVLRDLPPAAMELIETMTLAHSSTTSIREAIRLVY